MAATILQNILADKADEVAAAKQRLTLAQLESQIASANPCRGFVKAMARRIEARQPAVIAEIKKASPSRGLIREDFDPAKIAADYAAHGAACLSVLTDGKYFAGSVDYLRQARAACALPVLRKDFMIDRYQIAEARAMGADCILLIVAALDQDDMRQLAQYASDLAIDILVEVHNREELERALELPVRLIGINNRDLHSFDTSLQTTFDLLEFIPDDRLVVTESGIHTADDVSAMLARDVYGFLIGETFMRAPSPGAKLKEVMGATA